VFIFADVVVLDFALRSTVGTRVRRTGANRPVYRRFRCYQWPTVPVCTDAYRSGFKYFEFEFKN
jgi:hypothetical protein